MRHVRLLASLLAAATLAACTTTAPGSGRAQARFAETWDVHDAAVSRGPELHGWWRTFDDPVLDTLIAEAQANNTQLGTAAVRMRGARAELVRVARSDSRMAGAQETARSRRNSAAAPHSIETSWERELWGSAQQTWNTSMVSSDDALISLTGDVGAAYVLLRTLQERLAYAQANVAAQKRALAAAQARFRASARSELDVQQALAMLHETQAAVPLLEAEIRSTMSALSILVGRSPGDLTATLGGAGVIPGGPDGIEVGVAADLLRRRPDVRWAAFAATERGSKLGIPPEELYPAFRLDGRVGSATDSTADLFDGASLEAAGTFSAMWEFLHQAGLQSNARIEDVRFQESIMAYQATVLAAAREAEDALVAFTKAREEVAFREAASSASQRVAEMSLRQYRNGSVNFLSVVGAQRQLAADQDRLTVARGAVTRHLITAYKAMGGGWDTGGPDHDNGVHAESGTQVPAEGRPQV